MFHKAGYFMSMKKCVLVPTTRIVYLGIVRDAVLCRFEVPEDKLDKLEAIVRTALETRKISFAMLEKLGREVHEYDGGNSGSEFIHVSNVQEDRPIPTYRGK